MLCPAFPSDGRNLILVIPEDIPDQPQLLRSIFSDLENGAFALDSIEYTGIVNWNVLFGDSLDDLLRNDATSQSTNVVELSATRSRTVIWLVDCCLFKCDDEAFAGSCLVSISGTGCTYSSRVYSPICDLIVTYSSSSMSAFASLTRSFAILKAIPVSFSESVSTSLSPATRGAPPRPS